MPKRTLLPLLVVTGCGLLLSYPLLRYGLPVRGDAIFHSMWYTSFAAQFFTGDLYPRWLIEMNGGLGSPVFFFYAPLPFYAALLFSKLLPSGPYGLTQLGAATALALVLSGITAYCWLKSLTDRSSAAMAAVFYLIAPYHLIIDLYTRVALAELWAFVWIPLVLYFAHPRRPNRRTAFIGLALSYAALILTHLPSTLIFSVIPPIYAGCVAERSERKRALLFTIGGMLLGISLAAIYLLPALTTQANISPLDFTAHKYFERWVNFYGWQPDLLEAQIFWSVVLLACVAVTAFVVSYRVGAPALRRERIFWLLVALVSVLMMLPVSRPVWQLINTLQSIQFPWRFNIILCTACAALVAIGCAASKKPYNAMVVSAAVAGALLLLGALICATYATRQAFPVVQNDVFTTRFAERRDAPEYRPATAASIQEGYFQALLGRICKSGPHIAQACIVEGTGTLTVERWQPRDIVLNVAAVQPVALNVSQFYYPGWTADVDNQAYPLQPSKPDGLINLRLPAGTHHVRLHLARSRPELIGIFVSGASVLSLLFWGITQSILRRRITETAPL